MIQKELLNMGYQVIWWNSRASNSFFFKALLSLLPSFTRKISELVYFFKLKKIARKKIDVVFLIKGDGLTRYFLNALKDRFLGARFFLYSWDSIENNKHILNICDLFESIKTFDYSDSIKKKWGYRPLFSSLNCRKAKIKQTKKLYDLCFIATNHSDRIEVVREILNKNRTLASTSYFYLYVNNFLVYFLCFFKSPTFFLSFFKYSHVKTLPYSLCLKIISQSRAVLDIEHPKQAGLTMRTIETLILGTKVITTNKHIIKSDLYHPTRVCLIDRINPVISKSFMRSSFKPLPRGIKAKYSTQYWIRDILNV
jgi:hypothetical protein